MIGTIHETRQNLTTEKGVLAHLHRINSRLLVFAPGDSEIKRELNYAVKRTSEIDKQLAEMAQRGRK